MKRRYLKGTHYLVDWLWNRMDFLKRKRVKFNVDLQVCTLSDVPLVNAVLFAKVRLLDGGHFEDHTERVEVSNHSSSWSHRSSFPCRIASDQNGMLEPCLCRISIRKEQKGGRSYAKLGYVDINLSEFAASGVEGIGRSYLLDGYGLNPRQDNSKLLVKVVMCHQSADPFFRVPRIADVGPAEEKCLNPMDRRAPQVNETEEGSIDKSMVESETEQKSVQYRGTTTQKDKDEQQEAGSSSGTAEDAQSVASDSLRRTNVTTALRRLSQDRSSAPRVQSTRVDAGDVIDSMLAASRLSEPDDTLVEGLELYVGKDGEAVVGQRQGYQRVALEDEEETNQCR